MQAKLKHIVLACSNAGELAMQQDVLGEARPSVNITVATTGGQLEDILCRITPDLIIVLRVSTEKNGGENFLQVIRQNDRHDEIPVFVYTITPGKKDLGDLLRKWRGIFSFFPL